MDYKQAMLGLFALFGLLIVGCGPQTESGSHSDDPGHDAATAGAVAITARPMRVISLDLCADQYVFALADRAQILALSRNAADPGLSAIAARAKRISQVQGSAEEVLRLRPDLVVVGPYQPVNTMQMIEQMGYPTVTLNRDTDFADITANIRNIATALGHQSRGEALIGQMVAQLAIFPKTLGQGRVAAYYQRRGFVTGTGTLVDDMMQRLGLRNLAADDPFGTLGRLSIEEMAVKHPDFLIMEQGSLTPEDRGTEMLTHPVLARAFPAQRQLVMPQALTTCGGPSYPRAVAALAGQLEAAHAVLK